MSCPQAKVYCQAANVTPPDARETQEKKLSKSAFWTLGKGCKGGEIFTLSLSFLTVPCTKPKNRDIAYRLEGACVAVFFIFICILLFLFRLWYCEMKKKKSFSRLFSNPALSDERMNAPRLPGYIPCGHIERTRARDWRWVMQYIYKIISPQRSAAMI